MGVVCSICVNKTKETDGTPPICRVTAPRARVYPLLCHLESDFYAVASKGGRIGPKELAELWKISAERKVGKLSAEDIKIIREDSKLFFNEVDLDNNGVVDFNEFATFMLGGNEERGNLKCMRKELHRCIQADPTLLSEVIRLFRKWDVNGDGFLSKNELLDHITELDQLVERARYSAHDFHKPNTPRKSMTDQHSGHAAIPSPVRHTTGGAHSMVAELNALMDEGDADNDGRIDLWELLAHVLGRRKTPVELLLYDISDGLAEHYSTLLLGRHFEAIYHSALLVYGYEYWFGGEIFRLEPPSFGRPPLTKSVTHLRPSAYCEDLRTVHLGYTLANEDEFVHFIEGNLMEKYTPETYDVLTNNCNCFSNECAHFLIGTPIPEEVSCLPQLAMNTPVARLLRPFLNKWLGGFGKDDQKGEGPRPTLAAGRASPTDHNVVLQSLLGKDVVVLQLNEDHLGAGREQMVVIGTVLSTNPKSQTVHVKFFDHVASAFTECKSVPMSCVIENRTPHHDQHPHSKKTP